MEGGRKRRADEENGATKEGRNERRRKERSKEGAHEEGGEKARGTKEGMGDRNESNDEG